MSEQEEAAGPGDTGSEQSTGVGDDEEEELLAFAREDDDDHDDNELGERTPSDRPVRPQRGEGEGKAEAHDDDPDDEDASEDANENDEEEEERPMVPPISSGVAAPGPAVKEEQQPAGSANAA